MIAPAGGFIRRARAVDPKTFRAAATGSGQTFDESVLRGSIRAQRAANAATAAQRAAMPGCYPAPTQDCEGNYLPVKLTRAGR